MEAAVPIRAKAAVPSISCTVSDTGRPPPFIEKDSETSPDPRRSVTARQTDC